jgi:hypothetical protein
MKGGMSYLFAIVFLISILANSGLAMDVALSDDAYHYTHNGIDDALFNEWWYFNGISNDTQFLFNYLLSDPENITGLRKIQVLAILMNSPPIIAIHQSNGYGADRNNPNFDIDQSSIAALNESTFRITGSAQDISSGRPVEWDLTYHAAFIPWFATPVQTHIGHIAGNWMKWLVYMPSAIVTGTITANNQTQKINAIGYHDHNWGRWAFNDPQWNWAQVSMPTDGFSLTLGEAIGTEKKTFLGINYAGKLIKFSGEQIKLDYADFTLDNLTARTYPVACKVEADNGQYKLEMDTRVLNNAPISVDYPNPVPSYVIFEQLSQFKGVLKSKDSADYIFNQKGFARYTTYRLHPIFGKINASDPRNITITARNERTGQIKAVPSGSSGHFSIDADYSDYLANKSAPWVEDGDKVTITVKSAKLNVTINLEANKQEVQFPDDN